MYDTVSGKKLFMHQIIGFIGYFTMRFCTFEEFADVFFLRSAYIVYVQKPRSVHCQTPKKRHHPRSQSAHSLGENWERTVDGNTTWKKVPVLCLFWNSLIYMGQNVGTSRFLYKKNVS